MNRHFGLIVLGIVSVACNQTSTEGVDLGAADDAAPLADLAMTDAASTGPMLSVLAGALGGSGNVNDTGLAARFDYPYGMALDGAGNLYVADTNNCVVRKVVLTSGVVSTLAGLNGVCGTNDGTGAAARFTLPYGIAFDAGNLYVSDHQTLRKIVLATTVTTTIAGSPGQSGSLDGTGASARFYLPAGLAADGAGNLYVADSGNSAIRKVVLSSQAVTTLAGSLGTGGSADGTGAAARFAAPRGVVYDGSANLYVADTSNHTVRKVVVANGAVTTVAGSAGMSGSNDGTGASARFKSPYGITADLAGNLYVTDTDNHTLRKIVAASGAVTTLSGSPGLPGSSDGTGATARFNEPEALVFGAGSLYVSDSENFTLRKVDVATAAVTTLSGTAPMSGSTDGPSSAARFKSPQALALDGTGNLYVADSQNSTVRKIVLATGAVTTLAGSTGLTGTTDGIGSAARFFIPYGIAADGAGNVYVADTNNHSIRKLVVATGTVTTLAGTPGVIGNNNGTGTAARFYFPFGLALDGAGNLYVADRNNHAIRKIEIGTAIVTTLAGSPGIAGISDGNGTAARFNYPLGVALDGAGSAYVTDSTNSTIRKIVLGSGAVTTIAGTATISGTTDGIGSTARFFVPFGIAADGMGNLFVADQRNNTVRRIELGNANVTTLIGVPGQRGVRPGPLPALLNRTSGLAAGPMGELFILSEDAVLLARWR